MQWLRDAIAKMACLKLGLDKHESHEPRQPPVCKNPTKQSQFAPNGAVHHKVA
ncbi:MAG: hypothetical protein ACI87E_002459 [Mariniblastus sp.]|jgi:hypothetical protein